MFSWLSLVKEWRAERQRRRAIKCFWRLPERLQKDIGWRPSDLDRVVRGIDPHNMVRRFPKERLPPR